MAVCLPCVRYDVGMTAHGLSVEERLLLRRSVTPVGCWEFLGSRDDAGYGTMKVSKKTRKVHRLAYEVWVGPIPAGLDVLHHCDNPPCFNPTCLFLGDDAANVLDKAQKGRAAKRLSAEQVLEIRRLDSAGTRNMEIADQFDISRSTVSNITHGTTWRHLL